MFLKGCNFDIKTLIILQLIFKDILSCSIQVCLTWEAQRENITFKCKVNHLTWKVGIYNPLNEEQGHCLNPLPTSKCYPLHNNTMFQERRTNTTILILKNNKYRKVTGSWKCYHGTNRDKAIVIVTDLNQESIKKVSESGNCFEEYLAWTFIGVMIDVILILITRTFFNSFKHKFENGGKICRTVNVCWGFCMIPSEIHDIVKLCIGILLSIVVILVPFMSGKRISVCKDKRYFLVFGCVTFLVFVICFSRKDGLSPRCRTVANEDNADVVIELQGGHGEEEN